MKQATLLLAATLAALAGGARADAVKLNNKLSYDPVTVKGFSDGALNFLFGQTAKLESLENIAQITLAADAQFSQAEEALAKGQYQEALAAYAAAAKTAAKPSGKSAGKSAKPAARPAAAKKSPPARKPVGKKK